MNVTAKANKKALAALNALNAMKAMRLRSESVWNVRQEIGDYGFSEQDAAILDDNRETYFEMIERFIRF